LHVRVGALRFFTGATTSHHYSLLRPRHMIVACHISPSGPSSVFEKFPRAIAATARFAATRSPHVSDIARSPPSRGHIARLSRQRLRSQRRRSSRFDLRRPTIRCICAARICVLQRSWACVRVAPVLPYGRATCNWVPVDTCTRCHPSYACVSRRRRHPTHLAALSHCNGARAAKKRQGRRSALGRRCFIRCRVLGSRDGGDNHQTTRDLVRCCCHRGLSHTIIASLSMSYFFIITPF
jgi:hypothetical protein